MPCIVIADLLIADFINFFSFYLGIEDMVNCMMGSNYEAPKCKIDRISSLPDDVLAQILSLMPTICAVKTSTLSKTWRFRWTCVTSLDFDFSFDTYEDATDDDAARFANFVDRVFQFCNSSQIQSIRFRCYGHILNSARVGMWINEAVRRSVKVLFVAMFAVQLPSSLFMCKTVEELFVGTSVCDIIILSICLPCLKILKISWDQPPHDLSEKLFCSCPVLEELYLDAHVNEHLTIYITFNISSTTLKKLAIRLHGDVKAEKFGHKVIINTPNLECLYLEDNYLPKYVVENVSSLVKAKVNVGTSLRDSDRERDRAYYECAFELVRAISGVEWLHISSGTMRCLEFPDAYNLPTFHNVTRLEVIIRDLFDGSLLLKIFESSPNLEALYVKKELLPDIFEAGDEEEELTEKLIWINHDLDPDCFQSFKAVGITGYNRNWHELQVLEYLLGRRWFNLIGERLYAC